ncbi:MAG: cytochrome c biogenesis protein ResB, partial [Rubrivivax sp.]
LVGGAQAREFHNYMLPVDTGDGLPVFLLGMRESQADAFRYMRIPMDDQGGLDGFLRLKASLEDPAQRAEAVRRYARRAVDPARPELADQLAASASRALSLFAGESAPRAGQAPDPRAGGLQALADFMEANVPEAERARAGDVLVRILNGTLYELALLGRERAGLAPLPADDKLQGFMTQAVLALSDVHVYPAPVALQLKEFTQLQASVFQVARAPGKLVVYLGCLLLILGVFAMLYVRERRLWVWLAPAPGGDASATAATMALSTNRKTMDGDREFVELSEQLISAKDDKR